MLEKLNKQIYKKFIIFTLQFYKVTIKTQWTRLANVQTGAAIDSINVIWVRVFQYEL